MLCLSVVIAKADNWNEVVNEFTQQFNQQASLVENQLAASGIDCKVSSWYQPSDKLFVLEIRWLDRSLWESLGENAMKASKDAMVGSYCSSYKTDPDFRHLIDLMKQNNARFKVVYSCDVYGTIKDKTYYITPQEIMK